MGGHFLIMFDYATLDIVFISSYDKNFIGKEDGGLYLVLIR